MVVVDMEMSIRTVCVTPSPVAQIAVLVAVIFPLIALPVVRRCGFASAFFPLLMNAALACVAVLHALRGWSIIGHGMAGFSAGLAEAQSLFVAGACSTIVSVAIVVWRRPSPTHLHRVTCAAIAVVVFVEPILALAVAKYTAAQFTAALYGVGITGIALFLAAFATLFASRGAALRPLALVAAIAAAAGVEGWLVMRHFQDIALYGVR